MKFSVSLHAIAILAGPVHSVLGSSSFFSQVEGQLQVTINDVNNAIANFKALKVNGDLQTSTLVGDYQKVQTDAQTMVNMIQGHVAFSASDQQTFDDTLNDLSSKNAKLFQVTGDSGYLFEIPADQNSIQNAANAYNQVDDVFFVNALSLAPKFTNDINLMKSNIDQANADMNNQFANSPLRRRQVSRVFEA